MKLLAPALLIAASASSALARAVPIIPPRSPVPALSAPANGTTSAGNGTAPFRLVSKSANSAFNGQYLEAYHTGAGFNDATFAPNGSGTEAVASLTANGTLVFHLEKGISWGAILAADTNYAAWEPVQINIGGLPDFADGFSIKQNKLVLENEDYGWEDWIICYWYHGVPQLFYAVNGYGHRFSSNCAKADLLVEYVSQ